MRKSIGEYISNWGKKTNFCERRLHDNFDEISIENFGLTSENFRVLTSWI